MILTDRLGLNSNYTPVDLRQALGDFVKRVRGGSPESKFAAHHVRRTGRPDDPIHECSGRARPGPGPAVQHLATAAIIDGVSDAAKQLAAAPTERRAVLVVASSYRQDQSSLRTDLAGEALRISIEFAVGRRGPGRDRANSAIRPVKKRSTSAAA